MKFTTGRTRQDAGFKKTGTKQTDTERATDYLLITHLLLKIKNKLEIVVRNNRRNKTDISIFNLFLIYVCINCANLNYSKLNYLYFLKLIAPCFH